MFEFSGCLNDKANLWVNILLMHGKQIRNNDVEFQSPYSPMFKWQKNCTKILHMSKQKIRNNQVQIYLLSGL